MFRHPFFLLFVFILSSCTSNEIGNSKDVKPEAVYFDYKVWGGEDDSIVTVRLQYRFGGDDGTTLLLEEPAKVTLDGEEIPVDSSAFLGAYYEVVKPVSDFSGKHTIIFTDPEKKEYKEEFEFPVFYLKKELPAIIKRDDLRIELGGLKTGDKIRIVLTDTSFYSRGIDRVDSVGSGIIFIAKEELVHLVNGPVHLEIIRDEDKRLGDMTKEGGHLYLSYGLKREFVLED